MSDQVLVTGAAGFVGSHLCEALLSQGRRVIGIDCLTDNYDERIKRENLAGLVGQDGFELVEQSLNDADLGALVDRVSHIFHLAAQPGVRQSWHERFDEYVDANVIATHKLCEAARGKPIKRFVYASSSSVYGDTAELPMSESHPTRPYSPYGVTKLSGEHLCLLYRRNYGLPAVALRFFTVYGPRQRPDMAFHIFMKSVLDGKPIDVLGNGSQTRDFTYIADIIAANLAAMDYDGEEAVFNIGGGSCVTLNDAIDTLVDIMPESAEVRYSDRVKGDVMHTHADISAAQRELGYAPKVALDEGLDRELQWVRKIHQKLVNY